LKYLLPISYLAPIEYFAFLIQKKEVFIESQEHFVKQSIRNRCFIYSTKGVHNLTIPKYRKSSSKTVISNIKISNINNWKRNHYESIKCSYNSSPFFEYYKDSFREFYESEESNLFKFNLRLIYRILELLKIKKEINLTTYYEHEFAGNDLRNYKFYSNNLVTYTQVFEDRHGFIPNLSIIDLLFNIGPETTEYLEKLSI